jgi:hypothetical protein
MDNGTTFGSTENLSNNRVIQQMRRYNHIFLGASRNNEMHMSFDDAINLSPGQGRSIDPQIAASKKIGQFL